jgi:hypothetical protein
MKRPRISDFDPAAKERELKSPMDEFPTIERPQQTSPIARLPEITPSVWNVDDIPLATSTRRKIKHRHAFDVYEDQIEELKKLALEDRMRGGEKSQSAMVREAIDDYIAKVRA